MVGDLTVANHFCIFGCMELSKDQACLIITLFKLQNSDRLISNFVHVPVEYSNLKVGDLNLVDEFRAFWLQTDEDHPAWFFSVHCNPPDVLSLSAIKNPLSGKIYIFDIMSHISFEDKV